MEGALYKDFEVWALKNNWFLFDTYEGTTASLYYFIVPSGRVVEVGVGAISGTIKEVIVK